MSDFFNIVNATFGISVAIGLVLIAIVMWLVYFITKKTTEYNVSHGQLTEIQVKHQQSLDTLKEGVEPTTICSTLKLKAADGKGTPNLHKGGDKLSPPPFSPTPWKSIDSYETNYPSWSYLIPGSIGYVVTEGIEYWIKN